jgi:radical SAM protein with 4Fe4S-binding SPASM domain
VSFAGKFITISKEEGLRGVLSHAGVFTKRRFFRALSGIQKIQAKVESIDVSPEVVAACMYRFTFRVHNQSRIVWNASHSNAPLFAAATTIVGNDGEIYSGEPTFLPRDFAPGSSCEITLNVDTPRKPGAYILKVDIARQNCFWFSEIGPKLYETPLLVKPHSISLLQHRIPTIDVTLDITNKCPLKCIQCRKTYFETFDEQQDMNFELFKKIAAEVFPHARSVVLSSAGEPLMTRHLFDAIEITREFPVRGISFITAGFHLNPGRAEKIVDLGVTRLEFSIDGATAPVYNKIRIGSDFNKVIKNIAYLSEYKKRKQSATPLLRFNFVLMKSNIHELPAFVDLAAGLGVEEVQCQHMVIFDERVTGEALVFDKKSSNESILRAKERARIHKIRFYHPPLFTEDVTIPEEVAKPVVDGTIWTKEDPYDYERKTHPILKDGMQLCTDPWRKLFIDWQGLVFPCCVWKEAPLGDLRKNSFTEIWQSERYRGLRETLTNGKLGKSCAECSVITGGDVNNEQSYFFANTASQ